MQENFDEGIQVEVLANLLKMEKAESKELLETLALRLQSVMPEAIRIERSGWIFSGQRPVKKLTVCFEDCHLILEKDRGDNLAAKAMKVVRNVVLKTSSISIDDWLKLLASELAQAAKN